MSDLWIKENKESVIHAIDHVFRRLLANLLLNFENPKFRTVRASNGAVHRGTQGLSKEFIEYLFHLIGFQYDAPSEEWHFNGSKETVEKADAELSRIETLISIENQKPLIPSTLKRNKEEEEQVKAELLQKFHNDRKHTTDDDPIVEPSDTFCPEDFAAITPELTSAVKKALLNTGRVRNAFFEHKDLSIRVMTHGRVYACTEKCDNNCLEAHWHIITRNVLYSYVAHLSPDGKVLNHLGMEYGYQYNSMPGTPNFRKTVCFTAKLVSPEGQLLKNEHPNKAAENCIYCKQPFQKLLL